MSDFDNLDQETARLRERLKQAVHSDLAPDHLHARIRSNIRGGQPSGRRTWWQAALVFAVIMIILGGRALFHFGYLLFTPESRESYISAISNQVAGIMRIGLGDHVNCAVFRKYPKKPASIEVIVEELAPKYRDLVSVVRSRIPQEYRLFAAHECGYHGRKFIHLTFHGDSRVLSVVITRKDWGESFTKADLLPALAQSGIPIYRAGVQSFQIAAFETSEHLVYFISDLPQQKNMDIMLALAPDVREFLRRLES
jgi:hypothetical protein